LKNPDKKQLDLNFDSLELKNTILDFATDSIYVFDKNLNYIYLNKHALKMVAKKPEEIIDKGLDEVFPSQSVEGMKNSVANVFKSGKNFSFEGKYILPVGVQWLNTSLIPIKDSDCNVNFVLGISRDVTEHKLFEMELKEREEHLRLLTDNMSDVIAQADINGILYVSSSLKQLTGFEPQEVVGKGIHDLVHPDDQEIVRNLEKKLIETKKPINFEYRIKKRDGSYFWVESSAKAVYDTLGNFKSIVFSTRNIDRRKQVEIALKESEKSLNAFINTITDIAFMIDTNGNFLLLNDALAKSFNRSKDDLIGTYIYDLIPGELGKERRKKIDNVIHSGEILTFLDTRDGIYFDNRIYPVKDEKGKVSRVVVFSIDVTNLKIAEKQIKLQNKVLEGINQVFEKAITSETEEELAKKSLEVCEKITESEFGFILELNQDGKLDALAISDPGWDECVMEDAFILIKDMEQRGLHGISSKEGVSILTNDPSNHKDSIGTPTGHPPIKSFLGVPLKEGNQFIGSIGVANKENGYTSEDLSILEKLAPVISESFLRKRAETSLKVALAEKELLLKEIHHRVKNNLMVISSLLSLQSTYIKDKEALGLFKESQNRARSMAMIHEYLYNSDDLKRINFGDYISKLAHELYHAYVSDPGRIDLQLNLEPLKVDINTAIPLGLIVNELLSNALKYAFADDLDGIIWVEFHKENSVFELIVGDDGIGFPDELNFKNTESLGLQVVNTLTNQIDGVITMEVNNGTIFTVKFQEEF
jgi:PAS domain S-box-containing protein